MIRPTIHNQQSWQLLTFLFALASFLEVAVVAHFVLFTPAFLHAIGFTPDEINVWTGPIASVGFLFGIWFVPFWGVLADRYGRKPLILRSYYVEVVAMALAAVSDNVWLYLFARALTGLALGNTGLMYASLTEIAPRNRVALALGLVNGSAPLGSLVGGLVGGLVVSQFGVHWLFGIDAIVAALIAVILTAFYRDVFMPKPTPHLTVMLGDALRAVIHSPVAATVFLVSFVSNCAHFFSYPYLPVRIGEIVGLGAAPNAIGVTQGIAGAFTLVGSAIWGALADRVGHRRMLAGLMLAVALLWLPLYAAQSIVGLTVAWAMLSAIGPSVQSLLFTIVSLNIPAERRGSVLSMIYLPLNLAFIVGPFTASFVARNLEVRDVFLVSAALGLVALMIFVVNVGRTHEK
jgi:DHA1 family multidrug resistance protein-like MFS transporter